MKDITLCHKAKIFLGEKWLKIGRLVLFAAATAEKKRLGTCDLGAGKFPIRSRKIMDIGSKNHCAAAMVEEERLWACD